MINIKIRILFFSLIFCCLSGFTQSEEDKRWIDSINNVLNNYPHDTTVLNCLVELSEIYYMSNADTTEYLSKKVIEKSKELLKQTINPKIKNNIFGNLAGAYNNIGVVHYFKGDISIALDYYKKSMEMERKLNNLEGFATSLNNIGIIYKNQGDFDNALNYYFESLKIREQINDKEGIANSLNNIGNIYFDNGDVEKGLDFYFKSLKIREEVNDLFGIANSLSNIAGQYYALKDYDKSVEYNLRALEIRKKTNDKLGLSNIYLNLGLTKEKLGDLKIAENYYEKSLKITNEIDDIVGKIYALLALNNIYFNNGEIDKSIKYANEAYNLSKKTGFPESIMDSAERLYLGYKSKKDYKKALEMYEIQISNRDGINNEANQKATIRAQTKYEFEKAEIIKKQQEKEKLLLEQQEINRRNNLQYMMIFLIIVLVFGFVLGLGFIKISPLFAEGLIFFAFLLLFEFILVFLDPKIDSISNGEPLYKLAINAAIAALIFPLHAFFENALKKRILKKSKC